MMLGPAKPGCTAISLYNLVSAVESVGGGTWCVVADLLLRVADVVGAMS